MSTLSSAGLKKSFESKTVIHNVSLEVNSGEIVGLLGPNGAGKTTTFYMIVGLVKSDEGSIHINDENITFEPIHKRFEQGISYLPQEPSVFRELTVEENIKAALEAKKYEKKEINNKFTRISEEFDLMSIKTQKCNSLSGGQRRRVEIARALASQPSFLLLDEPLAGIDPISISEVSELIMQVKEKNVGVLVTDHNVRDTLNIVERAYIIHNGDIMKSGTPKEIAQDRNVKQVYLGSKFKF